MRSAIGACLLLFRDFLTLGRAFARLELFLEAFLRVAFLRVAFLPFLFAAGFLFVDALRDFRRVDFLFPAAFLRFNIISSKFHRIFQQKDATEVSEV